MRQVDKTLITKRSNEHGFSLVEMAVVMLIIGLLMVPIFQGLRISEKTSEQQQLEDAIQNISDSLSLYLAATPGKVYPCPANPTLPPGAANYGVEDCMQIADVSRWPGGNVASALDIDGNPNNDRVLIGSVPFSTINAFFAASGFERFIPGSQTIDPYGMKITYAVSQSLTPAAPIAPNPNFGVVRMNISGLNAAGAPEVRAGIQLIPEGCAAGTCINDQTPVNGLVDTGYFHAVVLSHGEDRKGAWNENGDRNGCTAGTGQDVENCDNDAQFVTSAPNLAPGAVFFDDLISGKVWEFSTIWDTPLGAGNTGSLINTNSGNVGIGTNTPSERLDIASTLESEEIRGAGLCYDADGPGGNDPVCFDPARFTGTAGGDAMSCPDPDDVMTGIINGNAECVDARLGVLVGGCDDTDALVRGIDSDGNLICAAP